MSKEIYDTILKIRKDVPSIKHDTENKHDSYTYVSIDRYYTSVASVISKHGLVWRTRMVAFDLLEAQGKNKDRTYVRASFAYDLQVGDSFIQDYMTVPIVAPLTGAQTTGTVFSYAEKVFMRVTFCVATGEEDADHGRQERDGIQDDFIPQRASPASAMQGSTEHSAQVNGSAVTHDEQTGEVYPDNMTEIAPQFADGLPLVDTRKINQQAIKTIEEIFRVFMPKVRSERALRDWHTENLAAKERVKTLDPAAAERISAMFKDKADSFKK